MATNIVKEDELPEPAFNLQSLIFLGLALTSGTLAATRIIPALLPNLATSMLGDQAKVFWFLSRGTAFVSYGLLWLSMALGLAITNRMARIWPGGPAAYEIHEYSSLVGLAFGLFHGLILMGDQYIHYTLPQVLIPFASQNYRPFWVGLGQSSLYLLISVTISFYARKKFAPRTWRLIHYLSFLAFLSVLVHGLMSGTDTENLWAQYLYWISGGSLLFLLIYRLIFNIKLPAQRNRLI